MDKKKVPLIILKAIEPLLPLIKENNLQPNLEATIFKVEDPQSDFFFEIANYEPRENRIVVTVNFKPKNENSVDVVAQAAWADSFGTYFKEWIKTVDGYKQVKTIYDDPILEKYEEEFYAKLESADEDAETASFSLEQQLYLDESIGRVIHLLEGKKDESNEEIISAVIKEAQEIQATITESTKQETLGKLSKLFAKIQKGGLKLIKEVYPIIQKEIISQVVKGALQLPSVIDLIQ